MVAQASGEQLNVDVKEHHKGNLMMIKAFSIWVWSWCIQMRYNCIEQNTNISTSKTGETWTRWIFINVNILVGTLDRSFVRCCHWGKQEKCIWTLCIIPYNCSESTIISNWKVFLKDYKIYFLHSKYIPSIKTHQNPSDNRKLPQRCSSNFPQRNPELSKYSCSVNMLIFFLNYVLI